MQIRQVELEADFEVVAGNARAQAAVMVLGPGDSTGGPDNRHEDSDQWLWVVSGEGAAIVEDRTLELRRGTLLLIEAGEAHEVRCTGDGPLRTLNFYVPPEY